MIHKFGNISIEHRHDTSKKKQLPNFLDQRKHGYLFSLLLDNITSEAFEDES